MSKLFRKISVSLLALIMILFGAGIFDSAFVSTAIAAEQTALTGDINADGAVNSSDALCALMYCVNSYKLKSADFSVADVNANNIVNSYDALGILELSVGEISSFSEWKPFEGSEKATFSLDILSETSSTAVVCVKLKEGTFRNGTFKLNLHNPDLSCTNVSESNELSDFCDAVGVNGGISEFASNPEKAEAAFAVTSDVSQISDCLHFTLSKKSSADISAADVSLSVFDCGAKAVNDLPSSPDMPVIPTFSLNLVSEDSESAVISVKLESGVFRCGTFKLNFTDSFTCTNMNKGDAYIQNSSKIEDEGGTVTFAGNKDYAMAAFAGNSDLSYTGDYLVFTVSKAAADDITPDDFSLTVYDIEANTENKIPEPSEVIDGKVGDNLTWVLNKTKKTLTVDCDGTMPSFASTEAPWREYSDFIETVTVTGACDTIGASAFANCENIKTVKLPESVGMVNRNAFNGCTALEEIIFLNNDIYLMSSNIFSGCDKLKIWCFENSEADAYAQDNGIEAKYIEMTLSESSLLLADGESVKLSVEYNTKLAESKFSWISTKSDCVKVDNGLVTALNFGKAKVVALGLNNCSLMCDINVDVKLADGVNAKISDGYISGEGILRKSADEIKNLFLNKNVTVNADGKFFGTGDTVTVFDSNGEVYKTITAVIYGDVNSDGIYDATDAIVVSCIANGMLNEEQVGKATYMAADCNHDGVIDVFDADLLEKAGVLLEKVPQGKTDEELKTDSAYMQYLSLIDQSAEEQTVEEPESSNSFVQIILKIISDIISYIKLYFSILF